MLKDKNVLQGSPGCDLLEQQEEPAHISCVHVLLITQTPADKMEILLNQHEEPKNATMFIEAEIHYLMTWNMSFNSILLLNVHSEQNGPGFVFPAGLARRLHLHGSSSGCLL